MNAFAFLSHLVIKSHLPVEFKQPFPKQKVKLHLFPVKFSWHTAKPTVSPPENGHCHGNILECMTLGTAPFIRAGWWHEPRKMAAIQIGAAKTLRLSSIFQGGWFPKQNLLRCWKSESFSEYWNIRGIKMAYLNGCVGFKSSFWQWIVWHTDSLWTSFDWWTASHVHSSFRSPASDQNNWQRIVLWRCALIQRVPTEPQNYPFKRHLKRREKET